MIGNGKGRMQILLLQGIKRMGFPIALASSASKENIQVVLKLFCIEEFFQVVVSAYQVEKPKPSPDIFIYAADLLKAKPSDCIVIEDSSNGVKAAKAAGMRCVAFKNLNTGVQDLSSADIIIDNFDFKCLDLRIALGAMAVGFFSYGLSIVLFILAMRNIGASRTSAFFGAAPFAGVIISFLLFREIPNVLFFVSLPFKELLKNILICIYTVNSGTLIRTCRIFTIDTLIDGVKVHL